MDQHSNVMQDIAQWIQVSSLTLLVGIADHGSLSAGARATGIAQPNATRALKTLERRLGYPLVIRKTTGSTLTAEGVLTVQWAREVLISLENLAAGARTLATPGESELAFGASMTVAEYLAPTWIGTLHRRFSKVKPRMRIMNSQDVISAVQNGEMNFGFVETPEVPRSLRYHKVWSDEMVVVTAPSHPWAQRTTPLGLHELQSTPLIEREDGSGTRAFLDYIAHVERPEPIAEFNSNSTICQCVAAGMGPAVLSQLAVESQLRLGNLVEIPFDGPSLLREFRAIWVHSHSLSPTEQALLDIASA
ncbi:LysR family transcriptional regulator [Arthrobacter sp. MYb224]|uniref:LysR family transcriptional regulator n=1 Tax=Micrococcaceae TaxID=1268 RepID=UPI000CFBD61A|nr:MULTISPECIES: LysR family transcriptional regulator [unclassified Arthrobacter]PRA00428.1 LysR family transcriptional regulator [Arthrobacter sp. MYb224]PRA04620.1 LysR family transcriptional regulator [Arthrobacter sp. MYb229]PRB51468.1 LysR family transcriptional regulator [Arthrobacter sp. MYb216]